MAFSGVEASAGTHMMFAGPVNTFTAITAIWQFEVITYVAMCLTSAGKYFYVSQHSMHIRILKLARP